ncbi:hypothetical protein D3C76_1838130 [compost metagenome]
MRQHRFAVRPVRRHGVVSVRNGDPAGVFMDFVAADAARVPAAVYFLMVLVGAVRR